MTDRPEVIARADGVLGEVALRRRPGPVHELIINGVFLMDTSETSTERLLADILLAGQPRRVLVAGLGLGCTLAALLADSQLAQVDVVEIEPLLVEWLRAGMVPGADQPLADPRVQVQIADIRDVLPAAPPEAYDAVVLDVDNGPGFLVHDRNAEVYSGDSLASAARALRPGGLLAVWSAAPAPDLHAALTAQVGPTEQVVYFVEHPGRTLDYYIYLSTRNRARATGS
ncbi:MAG: hypothetical protein GEV12_09850 [Micromonosporaceae bacterium]|nr:hypothetical protein [Micromonosporaceae bacterium]